MRRFFTDKKLTIGTEIVLDGEEAKHIMTVLRMKPGDELLLINGTGREMTARILNENKGEVRLEAISDAPCPSEPLNRVTLFQCLPKAGKLELIIQKCVELGIFAIQPVYSKRCVVKPEAKESKLLRFNRVAQEAAKQSGRGRIPKVGPVQNLNECDFSGFDAVLIAYEDEEKTTLKQALRKAFGEEKGKSDEGGNDIAIMIGPEGGFEPTEVESVLKNSPAAKSVSLGKRILRTETAGMAMLAMLMYELEG